MADKRSFALSPVLWQRARIQAFETVSEYTYEEVADLKIKRTIPNQKSSRQNSKGYKAEKAKDKQKLKKTKSLNHKEEQQIFHWR